MLEQVRWLAGYGRAKLNEAARDETGASTIIEVVLVIGVVIILGLLFSGQIQEFFTTLWDNVVGDGGSVSL